MNILGRSSDQQPPRRPCSCASQAGDVPSNPRAANRHGRSSREQRSRNDQVTNDGGDNTGQAEADLQPIRSTINHAEVQPKANGRQRRETPITKTKEAGDRTPRSQSTTEAGPERPPHPDRQPQGGMARHLISATWRPVPSRPIARRKREVPQRQLRQRSLIQRQSIRRQFIRGRSTGNCPTESCPTGSCPTGS